MSSRRRRTDPRSGDENSISKSTFAFFALLITGGIIVAVTVPLSLNSSTSSSNDNNTPLTSSSSTASSPYSSSSSSTGASVPNVTASDGIYHYFGVSSLANVGANGFNSQAMSPDGTKFAIISNDANSIVVMHRQGQHSLFELFQTISIQTTTNSSLSFSDFGNFLALSNQYSSTLSIYQINNVSRIYEQTNSIAHQGNLFSLQFSGNSEFLCISANARIIIYRSNHNTTISEYLPRSYTVFQTISALYGEPGFEFCSLDETATMVAIGDTLPQLDGSIKNDLINYVRQLVTTCNPVTGKCTTKDQFVFNYLYFPNYAYYGFDVELAPGGSYGFVLYNELKSMEITAPPRSLALSTIRRTTNYNSTIQYDINYYGNISIVATSGILLIQNNTLPVINLLQTFNATNISIENAHIDYNASFILAVSDENLLHLSIEGF